MPSPILRFGAEPKQSLASGRAYSALFTDFWAQRLRRHLPAASRRLSTRRCRPEFADAIYEDLHWLGLGWPEPVMVQSERILPTWPPPTGSALSACSPLLAARAASRRTGDRHRPRRRSALWRHVPPSHRARGHGSARAASGPVPPADRQRSPLTGPISFRRGPRPPLDRPQIRYARPERWGDVVIQRQGCAGELSA